MDAGCIRDINNEASSAMDRRRMVQGCTTEPSINNPYTVKHEHFAKIIPYY